MILKFNESLIHHEELQASKPINRPVFAVGKHATPPTTSTEKPLAGYIFSGSEATSTTAGSP